MNQAKPRRGPLRRWLDEPGVFLKWVAFACVIGIVWGLLQKKRDGGEAIPWGPSIALGAWLTALCGQQIIDWYLGLL